MIKHNEFKTSNKTIIHNSFAVHLFSLYLLYLQHRALKLSATMPAIPKKVTPGHEFESEIGDGGVDLGSFLMSWVTTGHD